MIFAESLKVLPEENWKSELVSIRPISDEEDLWFATVECRLCPEQEDYVNPAGFSIGRAWMKPGENVPCIICKRDGQRIGFIVFRKWLGEGEEAYNWSYYIDRDWQGLGYGRAAAQLAVNDKQHEHYYGKAGYQDAKNFVMKVKWFERKIGEGDFADNGDYDYAGI